MSEIKRTSDSLENAKKLAIELQRHYQRNGHFVGILSNASDGSCFEMVDGNGQRDTVFVQFTPPAPEFEKGTLGRFTGSDLLDGIIGELSRCDPCGYVAKGVNTYYKVFTPIYQNDPVQTKAFELACERLTTLPQFNSTGQAIVAGSKYDKDRTKAHFLSQAKKELEK